jgi:hypothetical protein
MWFFWMLIVGCLESGLVMLLLKLFYAKKCFDLAVSFCWKDFGPDEIIQSVKKRRIKNLFVSYQLNGFILKSDTICGLEYPKWI